MADSTKPTLPSPMADITKRSTHSALWSRISNPLQLHVPVTASTNRCTRGFEVNLPAILAPALFLTDARAYETRPGSSAPAQLGLPLRIGAPAICKACIWPVVFWPTYFHTMVALKKYFPGSPGVSSCWEKRGRRISSFPSENFPWN